MSDTPHSEPPTGGSQPPGGTPRSDGEPAGDPPGPPTTGGSPTPPSSTPPGGEPPSAGSDTGGGPAGPAPTAGATSMGLDANIAAVLAYLVGWISGLVVYLVEKDNTEVRFHAAQSVLVSLALIGVYIALGVIGLIPVIGLITIPLFLILGLASFALWVYLLVQGYNLEHTKLPVVGDMAEDWADRPVG